MAPPQKAEIFVGTFLTCTESRQVEIKKEWALAVDEDGTIVLFASVHDAASQLMLEGAHITEIGENSWMMPSFVDTHIHAPQYLNAGTALDKPLMEWLEHYTFSSEARIDADPEGLGRRVYEKLVERMIESGTTLASVFGTLTVEANLVLAVCFEKAGIRGHIGKVNMDLNGIATYIETTAQSLERTQQFVKKMSRFASAKPEWTLVQPVITPRFVPTCSSELMRGLAAIADEHGLRVQSHMCESEGQVEWSKGMWEGKTDVEVLNEHGLLHTRSLQAHCTHSSPADLSLLAYTGTSIAHCPLSNVYFSAERPLPLREALSAGVKVGLGSDISGGYQLGIQESMKWAVATSRSREGQRLRKGEGSSSESTLAISWKEAIYLATLGGAQAMGMDKHVGSFAVGKSFDAQLIQLGREKSRVDWFGETNLEELIEKWWCNGREEDRVGVWVQGRRLRSLE